MTVSTATTDWHCSACSVSCSSKVSDLISSGRGSWWCPVDSDGGGAGVHSRETSGRANYAIKVHEHDESDIQNYCTNFVHAL